MGVDGKLRFQLETMKYFLVEVGLFVVYLSQECDSKNCSKMQATTKFRYRCSAHRKPRDCSSIQYMVHTLDLFTEKMNASAYQNTMSATGNGQRINEKKAKKDIGDLCRRVYRIFAHSFFHHRVLFEDYEANHLLCTRFIMFFKKYQLVPNALFKREIQIPVDALYFSRKQRKGKLQKYFVRKEAMDKQQCIVLDDEDNFMKNSAITELDGVE